MNQHKHTSDIDLGRGWLNRAAEMLDSCEDHVSDAEFAYAAAVIGNGFIGLAHAERAAASMAETSQVRQAILTMSDEPETTLAEAIAREKRAEAEARPHDDEPAPTCSFVVLGKRCTFRPGHHMLWHRLEDGAEVNDAGEPMATEPDMCSFVRDGARCVLAPEHAAGHELADGRGYPQEVDRG